MIIKRDLVIAVRVNEEEREIFAEVANEEKISLSSALRLLGLAAAKIGKRAKRDKNDPRLYERKYS